MLHFVLHALGQAGFLQHLLQNHFAPIPLHFNVTPQGFGEGGGLAVELFVLLHQSLQFGFQGNALVLSLQVGVVHAFGKQLQTLFEGGQYQIQLGLVPFLELLRYLGRRPLHHFLREHLELVLHLFLNRSLIFGFFAQSGQIGFRQTQFTVQSAHLSGQLRGALFLAGQVGLLGGQVRLQLAVVSGSVSSAGRRIFPKPKAQQCQACTHQGNQKGHRLVHALKVAIPIDGRCSPRGQ